MTSNMPQGELFIEPTIHIYFLSNLATLKAILCTKKLPKTRRHGKADFTAVFRSCNVNHDWCDLVSVVTPPEGDKGESVQTVGVTPTVSNPNNLMAPPKSFPSPSSSSSSLAVPKPGGVFPLANSQQLASSSGSSTGISCK